MSPWKRRLERAEELSRLWPFAREVLGFFKALTLFQEDLHRRLPPALDGDLEWALPELLPLLELVEGCGPPLLAARALAWRTVHGKEGEGPASAWPPTLAAFWNGEEAEPLLDFFPRVLLQPYALELCGRRPEGARSLTRAAARARCPRCGHDPVVSILREGGGPDGAGRRLICSLCFSEWEFPRVLCPACREEDPGQLPRFQAEAFPWIRADACQACRQYLKTVDLTKAPAAEPIVDELAATPLDAIMREEGFRKLALNLAGI